MNYIIPEHITTKDEIFAYIKSNKSLIHRQKTSNNKKCDEVFLSIPFTQTKNDFSTKEVAVTNDNQDLGTLTIKLVGNTTNILDSHNDVHIDGLWKKTLQENKYIPHLQEHEMEFEKIISDETIVSTKQMSFKSLGYDFDGTTQALIMESKAPIDRNAYMCEQYKKGYVKNHSVGMQYVKYVECFNTDMECYSEEKANWDKYYPLIANKSLAIERGYFFAVLEAKLIEISAVPIGSNRATPTQSVTESKEADKVTSTKIEPSNDTQKVDYSKLKFI